MKAEHTVAYSLFVSRSSAVTLLRVPDNIHVTRHKCGSVPTTGHHTLLKTFFLHRVSVFLVWAPK